MRMRWSLLSAAIVILAFGLRSNDLRSPPISTKRSESVIEVSTKVASKPPREIAATRRQNNLKNVSEQANSTPLVKKDHKPLSEFRDTNETEKDSNVVNLNEIETINLRWRENRDQFYQQLLVTNEEFDFLAELRNTRAQLLESIIDPSSESGLDNLQSEQWAEIAKNAQQSEDAVRGMLGASRYAKLVELRDQFNESLKTDPKHVISITSDW